MVSDNSSQKNHGKKCPKCGYVRGPDELAPEWQCPNCQIVYEKYSERINHSSGKDQSHSMYGQGQSFSVKRNTWNIPKVISLMVVIVAACYFAYSKFIAPDLDRTQEVVVFISSSACPPCDDIIDLLDEYGVEYKAYDINASEDNMRIFNKHGGGRFPLLIVGEHRVVGYDKPLIDIALNDILMDSNEEGEEVEIVMYSTAGCGYCKMAKKFFNENDIEFIEYFIDSSPESNQEFRELNGRGVPLIFIGEIRIDGFNEKALRMALKQRDLI